MSSRGAFSNLPCSTTAAAPNSGQIVAVDRVHHLVQLPLVLLAVDQALFAGFQHQIDGAVEFPAGVGESFAW